MSPIERRALRAEIDAVVDALGTHELRALIFIAARMVEWQRHGQLESSGSSLANEAGDFIVFHAFSEIKRAVVGGT